MRTAPLPARRHRRPGAPATVRALRTLGALALAGTVAGACADDDQLRLVEPTNTAARAPFMARYVALGNSITAGYQSGGIATGTQMVAYPALLAASAGTRYVAPYVAGPGCAPFTDVLTTLRGLAGDPTVRTSSACARVPIGLATPLNNVAVPGANSADPTGRPGSAPNALTTLMLSGQTQVQRALENDPTFVSVWIGNNDALRAGIGGDTLALTPLATFQANYDDMLGQLTAGTTAETRKGILVGVVNPANAPVLFPAAVGFVANAGNFRTAVEQGFLGGRPIQLVNCPANTTTLVSSLWILQAAQVAQTLPAGAPVPFACEPTTLPLPGGGSTTIGTAAVLTAAEQATITARVTAFNNYIRSRADAIGWAYLDPNATIARLRQADPAAFAVLPNLANPSAPFGTALSLDGVHPNAYGQQEFARDLITAINAKYGSALTLATRP